MMIVNGIYDNDFKKFFKYAKEIKELPPIPKNFNTKHLQDFINEFESVQQENARLKDKIEKVIEYANSDEFEQLFESCANFNEANCNINHFLKEN